MKIVLYFGKSMTVQKTADKNFSFKHIYLEMWALYVFGKLFIYFCLKLYGSKIIVFPYFFFFVWHFHIRVRDTKFEAASIYLFKIRFLFKWVSNFQCCIFNFGYNITCHFNPPFKIFLNCFSTVCYLSTMVFIHPPFKFSEKVYFI